MSRAATLPGQGMLFDLPHNGTPTSKAAAKAVRGRAVVDRERIRAFLDERGIAGATCDEIEAALGLKHQTASARLIDMRDKGLIEKAGSQRATRSGCPAEVYIVLRAPLTREA